MRISDWSSDVCSSDLAAHRRRLVDRLACLQPRLRAGGHPPEIAEPARPAGGGARLRPRAAQGLWPARQHRARRSEAPLLGRRGLDDHRRRSEEHTSELQSLMRISYAVFCLKKKKKHKQNKKDITKSTRAT